MRKCVSPQMLVNFHEGIVQRQGHSLQRVQVLGLGTASDDRLENCQAKSESSIDRVDSGEAHSSEVEGAVVLTWLLAESFKTMICFTLALR